MRPLKDQLVSKATARPSVSHTTTIENVNSNVTRIDPQK